MSSRRTRLGLPVWEAIPTCVELKIDGLSMTLRYENRKLVRGLTRGDGKVGEDVTQNVFKVAHGIPKRLPKNAPDVMEVIGEIFISKADFEEVRKDLETDLKIVNPRNVAAGSIRQKDPEKVAKRKLSFIPHGIGEVSESIADTWSDTLDFIKGCGIGIDDKTSWVFNGNDSEILDLFEKISKDRSELPIDIDGLVYKIDRFDHREVLGHTEHSPRWAIAHKFESEKATTVLKEIVIQVGRTGKITPVAKVAPVTIGGVVVSSATLHNFEYIHQKDLRIGDFVRVERAGDVIPKILEYTTLSEVHDKLPKYEMISKCPHCESDLFQFPGIVDLYCSAGLGCSGQVVNNLIHLASKDALDINGLGEEIINELYSLGMIGEPADIFKLKSKDSILKNLPGWGEKSVEKLLWNIEESRYTTTDRAIYALGVKSIGRTVSRKLALKLGSPLEMVNHLKELSLYQEKTESLLLDAGYVPKQARSKSLSATLNILDISGIGNGILEQLLKFVRNDELLQIAYNLWDQLDIENLILVDPSVKVLDGLNVVFTGTLSVSRDEAKSVAESLGVKVSDKVTTKTNYLVVGQGGGSKRKLAEQIKTIKILTESEWNALILGNNINPVKG